MSNNWNTFKLGDIADIGSSKRIKMADYVSEGIPFYRSKEIIEKNKGNEISTELFITEKQFGDIEKKFGAPKELDILLTSVGTLGVPYQVQKNERFYFKDGNLTWLRNFRDFVNPRYIYFWLTSSIAKRKIDEVTIGSTQQALTIVALKSLTIDLPSLKAQNIIVQHLEALDGKIAINRLTNQTLEQMAQALFKSWFVDFDPVVDNALAAGNPIPDELAHRVEVRKKAHALRDFQPLPEHIRNLFPCVFEQTAEPTVGIDGWVPKGWKVGELKQHAQIKMGQSPKGDTYNGDGVGMPLVNGPVEFGDYFTKQSKWTSAPTKISGKGDLIVCVRGSTTGRYVKSNGVYCIGRGVCSVTGKLSQVFTDFIFINSINALLGLATGSTFPNWSSQILNEFKVILPEKSVIKVFDYFASKNVAKIESNVIESESLTKLRDTLLPKLISGEIQLHPTASNDTNNKAELQGV